MGAPAQGQTQQMQQAPSYQGQDVYSQASQGLTQAMQGAQAGMGFTPMAVRPEGYRAAQMGQAPTVSAEQVGAGQIAGTDLSAYINPYESQVVQQSLSDIDRQRQMEQMQRSAQAGAAGAFGGSRHGIAEAETSRAYAEQAAQTAAGLRQAGFDRATTLAGQDIGTRMQADLANQAAALQAGTTTANLAQQSALANQAAMNQARQFGAQQGMTAQQLNQQAQLSGAQQRLSAGSQLGNLANLGFGMGQQIQSNMSTQGTQQQAINQALIDAAKGQYSGYTGAPATSLSYLLSAVGASPQPTTTTQSKDLGLFDYLSLGLGAF